MQGLICHCCGASNAPDPSVTFVDCEYCSAAISVVSFYKNLSANSLESLRDAGLSEDESKQISRLLQDAETLLETEEYKSAAKRYEEVLRIYPSHFPSRLNMARCILLDRDIDVMTRCEQTVKFINAIPDNQRDPELNTLIHSLAFDMASLGKERVNGLEALEIFKISRSCAPINEERDSIIQNFILPLREKAISKIREGIKKDKQKFSPSSTEIGLLIEYARYDVDAKSWCFTLIDWINQNKRSMHQRTVAKLPELESAVSDFSGSYVVFSCGMFGISEKSKEV